MHEMLKRSHWLFITAILFGTLIIITSYSYAGTVLAEIPYSSSSAHYASRKGLVSLKWSKAYSRLSDGTVSDVSGYQIQYSKSKSFSKAKSIYVGNKVNKYTIPINALNTKKRYRKNIKKYHFRIRSYIRADGKKVYSKWCEASGAVNMVMYSPAVMKTLTAKKNTVTSQWEKVKGATGYIVFNMKSGAKEWKKRTQIKKASTLKYKDSRLEYYTTYKYTVIAYKKKKTSDPTKYNSSYLMAIQKAYDGKTAATGEFKMSKPTVRAVIGSNTLNVMLSSVEYADKYIIQYDTSSDFGNAQTKEVKESELIQHSAASYSYEIQNLTADQSYYVRVMATGSYKSHACQSEFSDTAVATSGTGTYQIVFDGNSATSGRMSAITVGTGQQITLPANKFKRSGYVFDGWCYGENNGLFLDSVLPMQVGLSDFGDKDTVQDLAGPDQTITLYACWRADGPVAAADWAITIACDDSFYYGTKVKNHCYFCDGGAQTYICNALVAAAYTHGMRYFTPRRISNNNKTINGSTSYKWWLKNGFSSVGRKAAQSKIKKGDVICCWNGKRWCHVMIAATDGSASNALVAHASGKGTGPTTIKLQEMKGRLAKYKSYYVVRLKKWKSYDPTAGL